jgi:hypothetical protein
MLAGAAGRRARQHERLGFHRYAIEQILVLDDGENPRLAIDGARRLDGRIDKPIKRLTCHRLRRVVTNRAAAVDGVEYLHVSLLCCRRGAGRLCCGGFGQCLCSRLVEKHDQNCSKKYARENQVPVRGARQWHDRPFHKTLLTGGETNKQDIGTRQTTG